MYHLAYLRFQWSYFPKLFFFGTKEHSEYRKKSVPRLLYDYIDVTHFTSYVLIFFTSRVLNLLTLQFNRRKTVYFKTMAHCVCCVWNCLERVWGSECAAGGSVVCVCVSVLCGCE